MTRDELITRLANQMFLAADATGDELGKPNDPFWMTRAKWTLEDVIDDYMRSFFVDKTRGRV